MSKELFDKARVDQRNKYYDYALTEPLEYTPKLIVIANSSLYIFAQGKRVQHIYAGSIDPNCAAIYDSNNIVIGSNYGGSVDMVNIKIGQQTKRWSFVSTSISHLVVYDKRIYAASVNGIMVIDPETNTVTTWHSIPSYFVNVSSDNSFESIYMGYYTKWIDSVPYMRPLQYKRGESFAKYGNSVLVAGRGVPLTLIQPLNDDMDVVGKEFNKVYVSSSKEVIVYNQHDTKLTIWDVKNKKEKKTIDTGIRIGAVLIVDRYPLDELVLLCSLQVMLREFIPKVIISNILQCI